MNGPSPEMIELFLTEASEHLQFLREYSGILQDPYPLYEDIERLYISAHGVAGTGGTYGYELFNEVAGKLAHIFQYAMNATISPEATAPLVEFIYEAIAVLESDLIMISASGTESVDDIAAFKQRYPFAFQAPPPAAMDAPTEQPHPPEPEPESPASEPLKRSQARSAASRQRRQRQLQHPRRRRPQRCSSASLRQTRRAPSCRCTPTSPPLPPFPITPLPLPPPRLQPVTPAPAHLRQPHRKHPGLARQRQRFPSKAFPSWSPTTPSPPRCWSSSSPRSRSICRRSPIACWRWRRSRTPRTFTASSAPCTPSKARPRRWAGSASPPSPIAPKT